MVPGHRSRGRLGIRVHRHDRGWHRVPRLHERHRGHEHRPLPPAGGRRDPGAGGALRPRAGELLPTPPARATRRATRGRHAGRDRLVLLRQLGRGGDRGRGQAREARDGAPERDRLPGILPRAVAPHDGDDHVQDRVPQRLPTLAERRVRRTVPLSVPRRRRRGGGRRAGPRRVRSPAGGTDRAVRDRGRGHRAGARRRRVPSRARGVPPRSARPLPPARDPLRRRRGAVRVRGGPGRCSRSRPPGSIPTSS